MMHARYAHGPRRFCKIGRTSRYVYRVNSEFIMATDTLERAESLLEALTLEGGFRPQEVRSEQESGLSAALIEDLILKHLAGVGSATGRSISDHICLPMAVLESRFA